MPPFTDGGVVDLPHDRVDRVAGVELRELADLAGPGKRPVVLAGDVEEALVVDHDRRVVVAPGVEAEHLLRVAAGGRPR